LAPWPTHLTITTLNRLDQYASSPGNIILNPLGSYLLTVISDCICYSSVGVWAKNCEALSLPDAEQQQLNTFINRLYSDMDDG